MKSENIALAVGAAIVFGATASYAAMPNYDPVAHCAKVASFGGTPSEVIRNTCLQQEQEAYNDLKPKWDGLPAALRAHCDRVASFGGAGTFVILKTCVEQELEASQKNHEFQFQR
jgi:hypothetical protein